ncbi:MAG TPA: 30S ribosomal protein S1 [bacterium]|nr:30S ribosomal protein S1 [Myxococcales bacterium]OQA59491.1 MAG: 30S ribosomal protein S1 [bacterium ADurb.Bin270]HPW45094.1 30S ribosomal protein S1 [bacterium]HQC51390.1 30S ribosomal protein S1 [bacterium]
MSAVRIEPTEKQRNTEFARLFEERAKTLNLKEGEIVKGKVVRITRDNVIVDIGFKSEGRIPIEEFKNIHGEVTASPGDEVSVLLESVESDNGMMVLSKERADAMRTWDRLVEICDQNGDIEGVVVAKVKGGLSVDIGVKAFLPGSQIDLRPARNLDKYVGNSYKFKIIKLNKRRGNVVLSRKIILEKERESMREATLANLAEGQVFDGIVKNVTEYGVFVDLGGIDGLLHVTDMTWGRINHPSEMFSVGDDIRVVVLKFDAESGKVSLGLKQLQPDPWQNVEERYPVGSRVSGKVVSLTDYGAFVQLQDGVEGLIHVSEMSWTKKVKHPSKVLSVGDAVDAIVLDVDLENKRISLGLKQIEANPWENLEERYPLGTKLKGTVRNIADFGLFVDVGGDIDGLVHISDLAWVQNFAHPSEIFKKGDEVEVIVLHIDPENERFSLGMKQLMDDPWDTINKTYREGDTVKGTVSGFSGAGLIVDLGDEVEGLVPEKQYSADLKEGDEVSVTVRTADPRERRFVLSIDSGN